MPKRTDIHKILVIGYGPTVIGQAAEFDYAGPQACYVINTMEGQHSGSRQICLCAVENGVTVLTALDTVRVPLDVLEEITMGISAIDGR